MSTVQPPVSRRALLLIQVPGTPRLDLLILQRQVLLHCLFQPALLIHSLPFIQAHNRTLNPASANNVFGVAMGPQVGMKGINNGWQVRNASFPLSNAINDSNALRSPSDVVQWNVAF